MKPQLKIAMSEKASTYLLLPEPTEDLIVSEPWSIETYAEGLMDELFADIDQILDSRDNLPTQTVQNGYIHHVQTITVPQIVLPQTQIQPVQVTKVRNNPLNPIVVGTTATSRPVSKPSKKKSRHLLSIILWLGAGAGLAIAIFVWLFNSGVVNRLVSKSFQQSLIKQQVKPQLPTKAEIEADLVNYMLGALSVIDKQETKINLRSERSLTTAQVPANQTALAYLNPRSTGNLPPVPVAANNTPPAPSRSNTIVERIYIPVYQAPQPMRYLPPPMLGKLRTLPPVATFPQKTLSHTSRNTSRNTAKSVPVKIALSKPHQPTKPVIPAIRHDIKPVAIQTKPVTIKQAHKPISVVSAAFPSVLPLKRPFATAPTSEVAPSPVEKEVAIASVTPGAHILEGLMELGKRSAALFKINGVTQRIEVGESIGSSGWTLVDVANGEAVIRRNGEVRSIYTGQKF